jgi:hypothetical protein
MGAALPMSRHLARILTILDGTARQTRNSACTISAGGFTMPVLYLIINLSSAAPVLISVPSGVLADCQQLEQRVLVSPEIESTNCVFAQKD